MKVLALAIVALFLTQSAVAAEDLVIPPKGSLVPYSIQLTKGSLFLPVYVAKDDKRFPVYVELEEKGAPGELLVDIAGDETVPMEEFDYQSVHVRSEDGFVDVTEKVLARKNASHVKLAGFDSEAEFTLMLDKEADKGRNFKEVCWGWGGGWGWGRRTVWVSSGWGWGGGWGCTRRVWGCGSAWWGW